MNSTLVALDEAEAVRSLAALAQPQRLRAFRALVVAGPEGLTPGVIAEQLGVAPSALSFHLKELAHAGLVNSEPRGRQLVYRAAFGRMNALLAYLSEHCCEGAACELTPASTCTSC
jgi:ArsR family transcriptional regulator